ncbi:MAG: alpha/beta hydrolase [Nitrospiraceae bacterium]|nr:alpha/beta hydrolase [Nitrospiraceae bacterium]
MIAARIRTLLSVDARDLFAGLPRRVLCIAGSHDGIVPHHNVEEIVRLQPSAAVRLIAGHHFAIYTNPNAAAAAITEYMRSQEE